MRLHPKARPIISKLSLPTPIQKYFSNCEWDIDLSNNTNPYLGDLSDYPDIKQYQLKKLYLKTLLFLTPPPSFTENNKPPLTPNNILFTAGSMEAIDLLLRTFSEPNTDAICVTSPTFSAYEHWSLIHNLRVKKLPLYGDNLNQLSVDKVMRMNPKITFICDPNNPTGTKIKPELIQKLCDSLEGFVVIDEAYIEFSDHSSSIFNLHHHENLIILRTLSKAWGLAGVRCGAIIADASIINVLRYVQLPFTVSSPSQVSVKKQLLNPESTFASWRRIKKNRDDLIESLSKVKGVTKVFKSETNFIMVILNNFQKTMGLLQEHKIQVLDCSKNYPSAIRVSIGNEEQNKKFLDVIHFASKD
ncbi:MAG: aminotransferase class I/II-fold pyridoxal phosphate-dependent enzyme [Alphaproteobacteria bacterium]|nr:aminotransferase class I/II-fold pyridoxal phosphate-dependent enzyme [Alphaproteobacteria bacterium]